MRTITWFGIGWLSWFAAGCGGVADSATNEDEALDTMAELRSHASQMSMLGRHIFFDSTLSQNRNQACVACHAGTVGWTGPDATVNAAGGVYEGSVAGRFGNRKPPASAYATLAPIFRLDSVAGFVGGNFWDGRATGWKRGSPAADQATGPFLNPLEQALPDAKTVVGLVCSAHYGKMFRKVWGANVCKDVNGAFDKIAFSLAAFEDSSMVNPFSSKFDAVAAGRATLDADEQLGLSLFRGKAHCNNCHTADGTAAAPAPFTDFTYDNLGVPRNPENPFYGMDDVLVDGAPINPLGDAFVDEGLGGFVGRLATDDDWRSDPHVTAPLRTTASAELLALASANRGKQKVPTLRNVDPKRARSKRIHTTAISTASRRSSISTTRAMYSRAAVVRPTKNRRWQRGAGPRPKSPTI
jgi:cytochrome c peroxidase